MLAWHSKHGHLLTLRCVFLTKLNPNQVFACFVGLCPSPARLVSPSSQPDHHGFHLKTSLLTWSSHHPRETRPSLAVTVSMARETEDCKAFINKSRGGKTMVPLLWLLPVFLGFHLQVLSERGVSEVPLSHQKL